MQKWHFGVSKEGFVARKSGERITSAPLVSAAAAEQPLSDRRSALYNGGGLYVEVFFTRLATLPVIQKAACEAAG